MPKFDAETILALLDTRIAELEGIIKILENKVGDKKYMKENHLDEGEIECDISECETRIGELYFIKEKLFGYKMDKVNIPKHICRVCHKPMEWNKAHIHKDKKEKKNEKNNK